MAVSTPRSTTLSGHKSGERPIGLDPVAGVALHTHPLLKQQMTYALSSRRMSFAPFANAYDA